MNDNLPPLPEKEQIDKHIQTGIVIRGYTAEQMKAYARAAIEKDRERQSVPATQDAANLLYRFERQWHRMGELWERCQGKGWPEKEGAEFNSLRDEKSPATRAALLEMLAAAPKPQPVQHSVPDGYALVPIEPTEAMTDATYVGQHCSDIWRDMLAAAPQPQPVPPEGPMAETVEQAARDVAKCLNERGGQGLDLRHVAMLVHYAHQPVQEPVPLFPPGGAGVFLEKPQAQPLSDERVREIYESTTGLDFYRNFARAIEQAHGITKGTT